MKVNVRFANGNCLAFLGQGYITSDDKKVFVRLYATSDLTHIVVKMYHHHGYSFTWPKAKELGLVQQSEFRNGTMLKFNRIVLFYKTECYYQYQLMAQLEIAFKVMDFKLL
jgi:hypothetical protein